MKVRRRTLAIVATYVALLHVLVFVAVWKSNFILLARKTIGVEPPEERSLDLYQRMVGWAEVDAGVPEGSVLVLGDSIMHGLDTKELAPDAFGFGLGGATIGTLMEGLPLLRSLGSARAIVLGVGVNDLKYRKPSEVAKDHAALLDALPPGVAVVVVSVLPIDERADATPGRSFVSNDEIRSVNGALGELCAGRAGCVFVDVSSTLADEDGRLRREFHAGDGWHLSPAGNAVLAGAIRDAL